MSRRLVFIANKVHSSLVTLHLWLKNLSLCVILFQRCNPLGKKNVFITVYSLLDTCLKSILPFITLLILNIYIIREIHGRNNMFNKGSDVGTNPGKHSKMLMKKKWDSQEKQVTIMLLLVSFALLILTLPQYLHYGVFPYSLYKNKLGLTIFVRNITSKLITLNNAINFFLYVISGSKFRQDLLHLMSCGNAKSAENLDSNFTSPTSISKNHAWLTIKMPPTPYVINLFVCMIVVDEG